MSRSMSLSGVASPRAYEPNIRMVPVPYLSATGAIIVEISSSEYIFRLLREAQTEFIKPTIDN